VFPLSLFSSLAFTPLFSHFSLSHPYLYLQSPSSHVLFIFLLFVHHFIVLHIVRASRIELHIGFTPSVKDTDRLFGLVVRVPGYRSTGPGFHSQHYQIF
jgi:hypothetical protein